MIRSVPAPPSRGEKKFEKDPWNTKTLSQINGEIKRMGKENIRQKLNELGLPVKGVKEVLQKRLKNHYKKIFLAQRCPKRYNQEHVSCEYFVVLDFEATCQEENGENFPHEIIEFPAVLVEVCTGKVISEFQTYCRPRINPLLSDFCTSLTGITQNQVDQAPFFKAVYLEFRDWLVSQNLLEKCPESKKYRISKEISWTFVTDGSADICRFLTLQCLHSEIPFPYEWAGKFCNLKRIFQNAYKVKYKTKIQDMLEYLELEFEGRLHSGIDDARNIARITSAIISDGGEIWQNEECRPGGRMVALEKPKEILESIEALKKITNEHNRQIEELGKQLTAQKIN